MLKALFFFFFQEEAGFTEAKASFESHRSRTSAHPPLAASSLLFSSNNRLMVGHRNCSSSYSSWITRCDAMSRDDAMKTISERGGGADMYTPEDTLRIRQQRYSCRSDRAGELLLWYTSKKYVPA